MVREKEYRQLQTKYEEVTTQLQQALRRIEEAQAQLGAAQQRIAELEAKKTPPPGFVKANTPAKPKRERKKRAPEHNHARRCEEPTKEIVHPIEQCPECQGPLSGISVKRRRQVIDIAPPPPVEITEHKVHHGWCSYCHAWREAPLTLRGAVVGQSRVGVGLMALIAYFRQAMRLPIRAIQQMLETLYQVRLSVGEISDLMRRTAQQGQTQHQQILEQIRTSPVVHADETGWRENGRNGYIWELATPSGLRLFHYAHSRASGIINDLLGEDFRGVLVTDFYAGYNDTPGGQHQRCWVHFLRDLHALKEAHPGRIDVRAWADSVYALYLRAQSLPPDLPVPRRAKAAALFTQELVDLAEVFLLSPGHPCRTLGKRLIHFQDELFRFVQDPRVPAHNNLAERGIRPLVIARKISGGSRSPSGSRTRMDLASLTQTWLAQHLNPFHQFLLLLQSPLPQL